MSKGPFYAGLVAVDDMPVRTEFNTVEEALACLRQGRPVVVVDDQDRENEGDLILAAEHATPEAVAFFLEYTSGFLCTAITAQRARELDLALMVADNTERQGTAFLVSVDSAAGTTTGISAADRSRTVQALADPLLRPDDLARPGHVLPLRAEIGGVLRRPGHTEAGVDLCELAGLTPAALLCELVTADRRDMMRRPTLMRFADHHALPIITIAALVDYRRTRTGLVERMGEAAMPLESGNFRALAYRSVVDDIEHAALVMGDVADGSDVLVRVHSECLTGDAFGSLRCDCGTQLRESLALIAGEGRGVLVYLRGQEGRGIGLGHKLRAYELQQRIGLDTVDANTELGLPVDSRNYGVGAHILADLGISRLRLITNNPTKYSGLAAYGMTITERVAMPTHVNVHNLGYLRTKRDRMGHEILLDPISDVADVADGAGRVAR